MGKVVNEFFARVEKTSEYIYSRSAENRSQTLFMMKFVDCMQKQKFLLQKTELFFKENVIKHTFSTFSLKTFKQNIRRLVQFD